jgi:hypothetical protein
VKTKYIRAAIDAFERWPGFANESVVPCTEQEIAAMAARLPGGRMPEAYRELLAYGGRKLGGVYAGIDISYEMSWALLSHDYRDILAMIRPWDKEVVLPPDLFVLNEHFGSNFTFVRLDEGDDPPVYFWEEGEGGLDVATREHDTFSAFLTDLVQKHISHRDGNAFTQAPVPHTS